MEENEFDWDAEWDRRQAIAEEERLRERKRIIDSYRPENRIED